MEVLLRSERDLYYVFEQPAQSWGFKMPFMQTLKILGCMCLDPICANIYFLLCLHIFTVYTVIICNMF